MKSNVSVIKQTGFGLSSAGAVFMYALSACACLGLNIRYALFTSVICSLLSIPLKNSVMAPDGFLLVPAVFILGISGISGLSLSLIAGTVFFIIIKLAKKDIEVPDAVVAGCSLGLAFCVTALFTTFYFGIGATGKTTWEMLKNYRYLGFHPNWRGVFYGTITLFAMITYPFKFKKLSKYLPKEVFSVVIPFVLNLWLNPNGKTTPILEVGEYAFISKSVRVNSILPFTEIFKDGLPNAVYIIQTALCFSLLFLAYKAETQRAYLSEGLSNILCGINGGFPSRAYDVLYYSPVCAGVSIIVILLAVFFAPQLLSRIPLHSLAVVFIVSAWQNVPFKKLASVFKNKKASEITAIFCIFFAFFFLQPFYGVCVSVLFTFIIKGVRK